jgi:hypothetical protein
VREVSTFVEEESNDEFCVSRASLDRQGSTSTVGKRHIIPACDASRIGQPADPARHSSRTDSNQITTATRPDCASIALQAVAFPREPCGIAAVLLGILFTACAGDLYQQRTGEVKSHIGNFYDHLQAGRVAAAVAENERLEAVASAIGADIRQSRQAFAANQVNRDWVLLKAAKEAAAENWLNLGRYLMHQQRYAEARGAYQRVMKTYSDPLYRAYIDQAQAGLNDVDLIFNPVKGP